VIGFFLFRVLFINSWNCW